MAAEGSGTGTTTVSPSLLLFAPRQVLLRCRTMTQKKLNEEDVSREGCSVLDEKSRVDPSHMNPLGRSIAAYLKRKGFSRTLAAFLSEANVEIHGSKAEYLDLEAVYSDYCRMRVNNATTYTKSEELGSEAYGVSENREETASKCDDDYGGNNMEKLQMKAVKKSKSSENVIGNDNFQMREQMVHDVEHVQVLSKEKNNKFARKNKLVLDNFRDGCKSSDVKLSNGTEKLQAEDKVKLNKFRVGDTRVSQEERDHVALDFLVKSNKKSKKVCKSGSGGDDNKLAAKENDNSFNELQASPLEDKDIINTALIFSEHGNIASEIHCDMGKLKPNSGMKKKKFGMVLNFLQDGEEQEGLNAEELNRVSMGMDMKKKCKSGSYPLEVNEPLLTKMSDTMEKLDAACKSKKLEDKMKQSNSNSYSSKVNELTLEKEKYMKVLEETNEKNQADERTKRKSISNFQRAHEPSFKQMSCAMEELETVWANESERCIRKKQSNSSSDCPGVNELKSEKSCREKLEAICENEKKQQVKKNKSKSKSNSYENNEPTSKRVSHGRLKLRTIIEEEKWEDEKEGNFSSKSFACSAETSLKTSYDMVKMETIQENNKERKITKKKVKVNSDYPEIDSPLVKKRNIIIKKIAADYREEEKKEKKKSNSNLESPWVNESTPLKMSYDMDKPEAVYDCEKKRRADKKKQKSSSNYIHATGPTDQMMCHGLEKREAVYEEKKKGENEKKIDFSLSSHGVNESAAKMKSCGMEKLEVVWENEKRGKAKKKKNRFCAYLPKINEQTSQMINNSMEKRKVLQEGKGMREDKDNICLKFLQENEPPPKNLSYDMENMAVCQEGGKEGSRNVEDNSKPIDLKIHVAGALEQMVTGEKKKSKLSLVSETGMEQLCADLKRSQTTSKGAEKHKRCQDFHKKSEMIIAKVNAGKQESPEEDKEKHGDGGVSHPDCHGSNGLMMSKLGNITEKLHAKSQLKNRKKKLGFNFTADGDKKLSSSYDISQSLQRPKMKRKHKYGADSLIGNVECKMTGLEVNLEKEAKKSLHLGDMELTCFDLDKLQKSENNRRFLGSFSSGVHGNSLKELDIKVEVKTEPKEQIFDGNTSQLYSLYNELMASKVGHDMEELQAGVKGGNKQKKNEGKMSSRKGHGMVESHERSEDKKSRLIPDLHENCSRGGADGRMCHESQLDKLDGRSKEERETRNCYWDNECKNDSSYLKSFSICTQMDAGSMKIEPEEREEKLNLMPYLNNRSSIYEQVTLAKNVDYESRSCKKRKKVSTKLIDSVECLISSEEKIINETRLQDEMNEYPVENNLLSTDENFGSSMKRIGESSKLEVEVPTGSSPSKKQHDASEMRDKSNGAKQPKQVPFLNGRRVHLARANSMKEYNGSTEQVILVPGLTMGWISSSPVSLGCAFIKSWGLNLMQLDILIRGMKMILAR